MLRTRINDVRGLKVLVAEQSAGMADVLASALKGIGVGTVQKSTSSAAAAQLIATSRFDAAIIDFDLEPHGAVQFTLDLRRSNHPSAHTPVIVLTSLVDRPKVRAALLAGVNRLLGRPVSAEELVLHAMSLRASFGWDEAPKIDEADAFLV
jgi:CheY-like chemotaxis protein